MFYAKNVPPVERTLRVVAGIALAGIGIFVLKGHLPGYLLAASGAFAALTGFVGFCPMCALVGRKLDNTK